MKDLASKISGLSSVVLATLSIVFTLLVVVLLSVFVIWPSFDSITTVSEELDLAEIRVDNINQTISLLKQEDQETIKQFVNFLDQYVPEKIDDLHFATLNEAVADAAGASVSSIQISKGASAAATSTPAETSGEGQASTPPVQVAQPSVSVTYASDFDSLLKLISFWSLADQLIGIKELKITGVDGQTINYTIDYELPIAGALQTAVVDDRVFLSKEQKERLQEIKDKVIYTATPSANSVGKDNPFN